MRLMSALLVVCVLAPLARAHELLSWWRRDLIEVELEPGGWARFEVQEWQGGESARDTLRCTVLEAQGSRRWVEIERPGAADAWIVVFDVDRLGPDRELLAAFDALYRRAEDGRWLQQSLDELDDSALARGRLEDPFEDPAVERAALPDSLLAGESIARERVVLRETRERFVPQGSRELRYRIELVSEATLSAAVPVFGLLRSETVVSETTQITDADGRRIGPPGLPQQHARALRCLDFGRGDAPGLPEIVR